MIKKINARVGGASLEGKVLASSVILSSQGGHGVRPLGKNGELSYYDYAGNITSTTDANGNTITYNYNSLGQV